MLESKPNLVSNSFHVQLWYGAPGVRRPLFIHTFRDHHASFELLWSRAAGQTSWWWWSKLTVTMISRLYVFHLDTTTTLPRWDGSTFFHQKWWDFGNVFRRVSHEKPSSTCNGSQWSSSTGRLRPLSKINPSWLVQFWQSGQMLVGFFARKV